MTALRSGDAVGSSWLYAGNTEHLAVLVRVTPASVGDEVDSDKPSSAVNQQERPGIEQWVVGFTDGEGCFSISVVRNRVCRLGWQVQHEFSITQLVPSRSALELILEFFGCGSIIENRRQDDHRHDLARFSVKRRSDLVETIVPFFEQRTLITAKQHDFAMFSDVIDMMAKVEHLTQDGLRLTAMTTERMNRQQRSQFLESSEAIRQPAHLR